MGVREATDLGREGFPPDHDLGLTDQLADAIADHVHPQYWSVIILFAGSHDFYPSGRAEDLALGIAGQVVNYDGRGSMALPHCCFSEADRSHLGVRIHDPGHHVIRWWHWRQPGHLLGDEDAVAEAAVGQLEAAHDVADG